MIHLVEMNAENVSYNNEIEIKHFIDIRAIHGVNTSVERVTQQWNLSK